MKKLFAYADQYVRECDWVDLTFIKFCLFSMGLLVGLCVTGEEKKKPLFLLSLTVFLITYIPLMAKFIRIVVKGRKYVEAE